MWNHFESLIAPTATRLYRRKPLEVATRRRVTFVQFGDYAEGVRRFAQGGSESYYAQRYSVEYVASLTAQPDIETVWQVKLSGDAPEEQLSNGVYFQGIDLYPHGRSPRYNDLIAAVNATKPTHLIVIAPIVPLIAWAVRARIPVLPLLADSFRKSGLKADIQYRLLATLLNHPSIEVVANHNLAASMDLKRIGVDPHKILPFDWPALVSPKDYDAKIAPERSRPFRMIFVGAVSEDKGVGDAIRALAIIRNRGRQAELTVIGKGDIEQFRTLATAQQVDRHVSFLGTKSHSDVLAAMHAHDVVLVPSRWSYPEGLPMTLYEGLCTGTPLVTSDHPMFALKIREGENALTFPEKDAQALANRIDELASSPDLYSRLSITGRASAENYLCPLKYDTLISDFLDPEKRRKLHRFSLSNYAYT